MSEEELRRYRRQMDAGQRREDRSGTRETSDATQQDGHDTGRSSEQVQQSEDNNGLQQMQGRVLQGEYFTGEDYKKAEEILEQNYQLSKLKSERTAKESGELAQYSDFVQRTDAIRELGGGSMFDDRDILKTARILQRTEAAGGSMDDLIGDPQERNSGDRNLSRQEELRPQSVMDYMSETTQEELRVNNTDSVVAAASDYRDSDIHKGHENVGDVVAEQSTAVQAERQGLSFFKEQFGEEKGEKYYEKMCSKYGEEVVSQFSSEEQVSYSAVNQILRNNMGEKQ